MLHNFAAEKEDRLAAAGLKAPPLSPQLLRSYGSLILMFGARVLHLLSLYSTNAPVRTGILPVGVWHWARSPATPSGPAGTWWMS